jgi:hypothetical protein
MAFPVADQVVAAAGTLLHPARWRAAVEDVERAIARTMLQATFLANDAYERVHAIVVTLVRIGLRHGRMLEWETAALTAYRGGVPNWPPSRAG